MACSSLPISETGSRDLQGDEMVGPQSEIHLEEPVEALAQKSRADQEHHGHGQLERPRASSRAGARSFPPSRGCPPRGPSRITGEDRRSAGVIENSTAVSTRDDAGEGKHPGVQAETVEEGHGVEQVRGDEPDEEPHCPLGGREPEGAAGQRRARQPSVTNWATRRAGGRAHGAADGDLTLSALGPDQQQAHDVDARDHEQQSGAPQEHQEGRPDVPDDHVGEGTTAAPWPAIGIGVLGFQSLRDGLHVGLGGLDGDAVLEPADAVEAVAAPPRSQSPCGVKRRPELGRLHGGEVELPWQHSDDDGGIAIQDDRLPQDVRGSPRTASATRRS